MSVQRSLSVKVLFADILRSESLAELGIASLTPSGKFLGTAKLPGVTDWP